MKIDNNTKHTIFHSGGSIPSGDTGVEVSDEDGEKLIGLGQAIKHSDDSVEEAKESKEVKTEDKTIKPK
jgi:hypothetical protein